MSEWHPYPGGTDAATQWEREQHRQTNKGLPLRSTSKYSVQQRTTGQSINLKGPPVGMRRWRWAHTPEYDDAKRYLVDEVVIVSSDTDTAATQGMWICVKYAPAGQYPVAPPDPMTDSDGKWVSGLYWVPLGGGGGGGAMECKITQLFGADYFGVKTWDGTTLGSSQFLVARSYVSRGAYGSGYTYASTGENSRTSDDGSGASAINPEPQIMFPPFVIGDVISVIPIDHSGVVVAGVELPFIEDSTERCWAHLSGTAQASGTWVLTP